MKQLVVILAVSGMLGIGMAPSGAAEGVNAPAAAAPAGEKEQQAMGEASLYLKVPLFSQGFAKTPVAAVNEDPILMEELTSALASVHEQQTDSKKAGKKNFDTVLNRLINVRLILQEAANMGLDETPEVKKAVEDFAATTLKEQLKYAHVKDAKPDPKLLEQFYREEVKEWKVKSVKFTKEEDAKALAEELKAGGSFDELSAKLIAEGKAEGSSEAEFIKPAALLPQVAEAVSLLEPGKTSPVIQVGPSFTILKLEEVGYPENADARELARIQAIDIKRAAMVREYFQAMKKKYAVIDQKLLKKLDYEAAKPGFDKMLKDKRVVARVKEDKPITVGDLAEALSNKHYHGIKSAIRDKKINSEKEAVLDEMLYDRVFRVEALKKGIDKTDDYKSKIKEYHDSVTFGIFIEKVVTPGIKVTEGDLADYYQAHLDEFSTPEMIKIKSLIFTKKQHAEQAIEKLRSGTDFLWLKANAEGQAAKEKPRPEFDGTTLVSRNLPDGIREAVAGAKGGDLRLHETPDGFFYLLSIVDVIPAKPTPLPSERKNIVKKVFGEKLNKSVEEWGEKLRSAYSVKTYVNYK